MNWAALAGGTVGACWPHHGSAGELPRQSTLESETYRPPGSLFHAAERRILPLTSSPHTWHSTGSTVPSARLPTRAKRVLGPLRTLTWPVPERTVGRAAPFGPHQCTQGRLGLQRTYASET